MTKPRQGDEGGEGGGRCGWCGRPLPTPSSTGRPRRYCRRSCRQRHYESRQRAAEVGLSEAELVVTREALDRLHDALYVLEAAIEDVDRDLVEATTTQDYADAVHWLLQAARPLIQGRGQFP